jgi:hypothetical protein
VPRWINVRQRWDRPKAARGQEMPCGGADRLERRQGVGRGEHLGRLEDVPDVVVAGDDPVIEVGAVEDRGGGPCLREERVRVGQVRIMKGIEPLGEVLPLDGPCSVHIGSSTAIDQFLPRGLSTLLCHDVLLLLSNQSTQIRPFWKTYRTVSFRTVAQTWAMPPIRARKETLQGLRSLNVRAKRPRKVRRRILRVARNSYAGNPAIGLSLTWPLLGHLPQKSTGR